MESILLLSEFLGTLFLILFGNGVNYSVSATKMFANQPGKWIVIALAWGFAVLLGVIVAQALGGPAHLNPAVSIYASISGKDASILAYIPFQFLGAIAGQIILNFINFKHIQDTDLAVVRSCHSTSPAYKNEGKTTIFNFSYELVGTLALLGIILAFGKGSNKEGLAFLGPLPVTFLVMAIGMSLGSSTGYAINPARDLGPRLVYYVTEKFILKSRQSDHVGANFTYGWLPVVAPSLGGVIIGLFGLI
ncbi:Aquaglyceroporin [Mesomycoplasma conjunctivae]|uniref:Glycerol uptake facilitator protein n=1 Tax=Mesomycoplasma conjunctivae (strain ATCC 25834 / NCTC 10147 / HRC/581) TaxID=572263 RepID=C5J5I0_MESCH|nr:MIP/aquaporin family protein [Mesomycoplasma conjunctivae]CAT04703.1 Glycerol uptake facilitator protein [Mesomycoplasma conjunctivae]VEU65682.1 Aquaglyceroporin [Mesomycoplasma conjunctivae]